MKTPSSPIIFWLVDPFSKHAELQRSAAMAIRYYAEQRTVRVLPLYFFSAYFTGEFPLSLPREWVLEMRQRAQEELNRITKSILIPGLQPLHIVARPYFSIRDSIQYLNRIIRRLKAVELIVTSTHGRRGLARFFLGSFAETLLLHVKRVPTLLVNPLWKRTSDFKQFIFPTDFSAESKSAYLRLLPLLQAFHSKITLIHKIAFAWPPALMVTLDVGPVYEKAIEAEVEIKRREARNWIREARKKGVEAHSVISTHAEDSIEESILEYARGRHAILALASQSGPFTTSLIGSTTRNLVRSSLDPVWVIPPEDHEAPLRAPRSEKEPGEAPEITKQKAMRPAA